MNSNNKIITKENVQKDRGRDLKVRDRSSTKFKRSLSKHPRQSRLKKYKKVWLVLGIIICIGLVFVFFKRDVNDEVEFNKSDKIQTYIYYSRGSKDKESKEQYIFKVNDPIQVKIDFKGMNDGDIVTVSLKKIENGEVKQSVKVPVSGKEGGRFVPLSNVVRKEVGKYEVEVSMIIKEKVRILDKVEFEIQ